MAVQDQVGRLFERRANGAWNVKAGNTLSTRRETITTAAAALTLTAAQSGSTIYATAASGTQTFTLPPAAAGLSFTFVCGNANGEILVNPASGDAINIMSFLAVGGAPTTARVAPAAGTGIKNTAASNVVYDAITLQAVDDVTWISQGITQGIWATQP